jgi:hypothetical protein
MTTDFRALCADLADALGNAIRVIHHEDGTLHISTAEPVLDRARAALAEPEPQRRYVYNPAQIAECGGPCQQGPEYCDCGELWVAKPKPKPEPEPEGPTPQPADGEVAELVKWLRKTSRAAFMDAWPNEESINLTRAATLLERLSPPQPVPVSEQLPGLDAKCWWFDSTKQWYFRSWVEINIAGLRQPTHWLPAHALPVPSHD